MIIVSACLTGLCCRFDRGNCLNERLLRICEPEEIIPLCPEHLGGLPTPRPSAEIIGGDGDDVLEGRARVFDAELKDVTGEFLKGAREFLRITKEEKAEKVILKENSPSCGMQSIYSNGVLVRGKGVLAALLMREGVKVVSGEDI